MTSPKLVERVFPIRLSTLDRSPLPATAVSSVSRDDFLNSVAGRTRSTSACAAPNGSLNKETHHGQDVSEGSPHGLSQGARQEDKGQHVTHETMAESDQPGVPEITVADLEDSRSLLTDRYEYAILGDGRHGVIQGTRKAAVRCEDELIHIPGAVQSYGMLVALRQQDDEIFVPRIVSENCHYICHYQPVRVLSLQDFNHIVPISERPLFAAHLRRVYNSFQATGQGQQPLVFPFSFADPEGALIPCWCAAHYCGSQELYVCEFELQDYSKHPLASGALEPSHEPDSTNHQAPADTPGSNHMDLNAGSSLHINDEPVIRPAGLSGVTLDQNISSIEMVGIVTRIQKQLAEARTVQVLLDIVAGVVHEFSKFHRVMVYQFDQDYNGTVVAEAMDPQVGDDAYRGLHFPASDIPPQARQLYMINKQRVLFDRGQETARLMGREHTDIAAPLDLTHSYLRAMSPVHLRYLANMGVRCSMSMSLEYEGKLWGLVICHSHGPTAIRIPFSVRELCYFISVAASTCLEKLLHASRLQAHRILETLPDKGDPGACISASSDELLRQFDADFGFLVMEREARTIGRLSSYAEAVTLLKYLSLCGSCRILSSNRIRHDFQDLHYPPGFQAIAGVLYIPLSMASGAANDCIVLFRKNQTREVHWAGKPPIEGESGALEPRNSFKKWTEIVEGTSKAWLPEEVHMATLVQLAYGNFIRAWREKETGIRETRIKRLLLQDASHKVRTPLNVVTNYLEMALESRLDEGTRYQLTHAYQSSTHLNYVIDDLLDLTGSTTGSVSHPLNHFDMRACLLETLEPLRKHAADRSIDVVFRETSQVSQYLCGDQPSIHRIVSTLVTNAIEHSVASQATVIVEWSEIPRGPINCVTRISVKDSGPGLMEEELDSLFQEFEELVSDESQNDAKLDDKQGQTPQPVGTDLPHLGVGLAFVARWIKQRNGLLIVSSIKNLGSTFAIELPFKVASRPSSIASRREASTTPLRSLPSAPNLGITSQTRAEGFLSLPELEQTDLLPPIAISRLFTSALGWPLTPSMHVLVADDNVINVRIFQKRLTTLGHTVEVGRNGKEAYELFLKHQKTIDFVMMDLNMDICDGETSTQLIRRYEVAHPVFSQVVKTCGRTPIFAVSGMLRRSDRDHYEAMNFDGWMPKPVDMSTLSIYLAGALDPILRRNGLYDESRFQNGGWFTATTSTVT